MKSAFMKIIHVVGARPNFMKIAPIMESIQAFNEKAPPGRKIYQILVHTGQHYDQEMSKLFFEELRIPKPDINLNVGSASHAAQTAEIMKRFEKVCNNQKPTHILVVGDVNSTIACALVAAKLGIKIIHVEAGLRSFDRSMPEEINRVLTDAISDILFITEESARKNLIREGISGEKIHFIGNVMIDTLLKHKKRSEDSDILRKLGLDNGEQGVEEYAVLTLHRPSNVDVRPSLEGILNAIKVISYDRPVIFPIHPRTRSRIRQFGLEQEVSFDFSPSSIPKGGIYCIEPLGYLDFLCLTSHASLVLTDSGGIQEETTILGVPCVTIRENTERPVTLTHGTNVLAGTTKDDIIRAATLQTRRFRKEKESMGDFTPGATESLAPPLWDGRASERLVRILVTKVAGTS